MDLCSDFPVFISFTLSHITEFSSFLKLSVILYVYHFFINLYANRHLTCFHILTFMNNAISDHRSDHLQLSLQNPDFNSLKTYHEVKLLDHLQVLLFSVWGNSVHLHHLATPLMVANVTIPAHPLQCLSMFLLVVAVLTGVR